jgi:hypothetical protein
LEKDRREQMEVALAKMASKLGGKTLKRAGTKMKTTLENYLEEEERRRQEWIQLRRKRAVIVKKT